MLNSSGARTLLIVEDSRDVRDIFSDLFQEQGYDVLQATDGEDALQVIERTSNPIHVILTDLRMPKMDGLELARNLKADARYSAIPIVLLSATPLSDSWVARQVFAALLIKPCDLVELVVTVEAVQ